MGASRRVSTTVIAVLLALIGSMVAFADGAVADLASPVTVSTTVSSNPVESGSQLAYTIDIVNTGGARADEVVFTDQVAGMTNLILTSTVGSCSQSAELVTCVAGSLEGFQTWRVVIRGTVTAANGTTLHNTASVSGTRSSQTFSTSNTTSTLVQNAPQAPMPDLTVSIAAPSPVARESEITYDLTVNNIGSVNATDVTVVNTLPAGFDYVSASALPSSLFSCTEAFDAITCIGGAVNAGANATITIKATAAAQPSPSSGPPFYDDTAVVDPWDEIAESNELNNTDDLRVVVQVPPPPPATLTITKTASSCTGPDGECTQGGPIRPGDLLTYTIVGKNTASTRADSVRITDGTQGLDAASIVASFSVGSYNAPCTVSASEIVCTRTSPTLRLNPNETMNVTITGRVVASPGSLIRNVATITGNIKNKGHTNTAAATTSVRPGKDLTITQRAVVNHLDPIVPGPDPVPAPSGDHPEAFRAYDRFEYHIVVGNSGLDIATGVVVREPLPAGVTYKGFTASAGAGFACSLQANNVVLCTGGTIGGKTLEFPGGQTAKIVIEVIAPNAIGSISATATVDPANSIFEGDETNNVVTTTTPIVTGIDLTPMTKVNFNPVAPSGTMIYTLTIRNVGTQDSTGIVVKDTLPAGVRFREAVADPNHNFTCSHDGSATGGTVECVGGALKGTFDHTRPIDEATITIKLFAPSQPGFYKNQVRVDPLSQIPEIDEANNINTFMSEVRIPPNPGDWGAYHSFTITKEHAPEPVAPNGVLTYTIVVTNHGTDAALGDNGATGGAAGVGGLKVRDFLPENARFQSAVDTQPGPGAFACTHEAGVVDCSGGILDGTSNQTAAPPGDTSRTIKIVAFAPSQPGDYANQAIVDPGNDYPEANETDNFATDVTKVKIENGGGIFHELNLTKTQVSPLTPGGTSNSVVPAGIIEWDIVVKNDGSDATHADNPVVVRDVLPPGTVFRSAKDSATGAQAFVCLHDGSATGGTITCTGQLDGSGDQLPGTGNTRTIRVSVLAPTQPGTYTNAAQVDPNNSILEANESNNAASADFTVALSGTGHYVDLRIDKKSPAGTGAFTPNTQVTYDIDVWNDGTAHAFNVVVNDTLPANSTFVSAGDANPGDGAFTCTESGGIVTCSNGYLVPDPDGPATGTPTKRTIKVTVLTPNDDNVDGTHPVVMVNQASIDPANAIDEASEINNTDSVTNKVESQFDLAVGLSGTATSGQTTDWTATVTSTGTGTADNVKVVIDQPLGVILLNVQPNQPNWSCQVEENPVNKITCIATRLTDSTTNTFTIRVFTTAEQSKPVSGTIRVDPDGTVAESDETNNVAQHTDAA